MPAFIALLRAVNVGGTGALSMEKLRLLAGRVGLTDPRTLGQSGNLVFGSALSNEPELERRLRDAVAASLGVETEFFVRGLPEWRRVVAANPFVAEATSDPARLHVTALRAPPAPSSWKELEAAVVGNERVGGHGRHAYIVYPDGAGRSRLTLGLIERKLVMRGTSRNWNTVLKLEALAAAHGTSI
ncbi:MAG: DUF1697 domain-containing protein [Thermoplasmata archaeon]|nr:DUF1697 domain-containing protein [Thermoplasmata archaeon]